MFSTVTHIRRVSYMDVSVVSCRVDSHCRMNTIGPMAFICVQLVGVNPIATSERQQWKQCYAL